MAAILTQPQYVEALQSTLGGIKSPGFCIYYACQTFAIYRVLPYSVDSKAPGELWNPLSKTVLCKSSLIWNKGPVNMSSNMHFRPVNIFPNFWHCLTEIMHSYFHSCQSTWFHLWINSRHFLSNCLQDIHPPIQIYYIIMAEDMADSTFGTQQMRDGITL